MDKKRIVKKIPSRLGFGLLALLLIYIVGVVLLGKLAVQYWQIWFNNGATIWLLNDIPLYVFGLPIFLLVANLVPNGPPINRERRPFGVLAFIGTFVCSLLIMMGINMLVQNLLAYFDLLQYLQGSSLDQYVRGSNRLTLVIFGAVVPAIGEEFIFRYMLLRKMRGCADSTYLFYSALCFGLFHGNIMQAPYAFVLGLVFGWVYLNTGRLLYTVGLHFLVNIFGLILIPELLYRLLEQASTDILQRLNIMVTWFMLGFLGLMVYLLYRGKQTLQPAYEPGWPRYVPANNATNSINNNGIYENAPLQLGWDTSASGQGQQQPPAQQPVGSTAAETPPVWNQPPPAGTQAGAHTEAPPAPPRKGPIAFALLNPGTLLFVGATLFLMAAPFIAF